MLSTGQKWSRLHTSHLIVRKPNCPHWKDEVSAPTARGSTKSWCSGSRGDRGLNRQLPIKKTTRKPLPEVPSGRVSAQRRELGAHTFAGSRAGLRGGGVHRARGRRLAAPLLSTSSGRRRGGHGTEAARLASPAGSAELRVGVTTTTSGSPEIPRERPPTRRSLQISREGGLGFKSAPANSLPD